MEINVYTINAKKGLQKKSTSRHTNALKIPVLWDITRCITQKSEVLTKDWFSNQYNPNGKYSGPNLLCERRQ